MMDIIKEMKQKIPENPVLKKEMDKLMENGLTKTEALNVMIYAWLKDKEEWM